MTTVKEVFGDGITGMNTVTSRDPHSFKELLLSSDSSVGSCFIVVESTNMKEKLLTKSNSTVYQDLLKTASWKVGRNIFRLFFFLAYVACAECTEWAQERKGRARETREGRGSVAPSRPPVLSFTQILPSTCYAGLQARSQSFLRENAIRRGDGPNEARAGGIRLCETASRAF